MTTNITESRTIENETILRQEIIESQKTQADFLKWKLISVATVGAISFGFTSDVKPISNSAKLLLCMIPVLCAYVDLISLHLMIRIITIGLYLKIQGNKYETYIGEIRERSKTNPFIFEVGALHGSSLLFNVIVVGLGFALPRGPDNWPEQYLTAYVVAGVLGIVCTIFLWMIYTFRVNEVDRLAKEVLRAGGSPEARRQ
jgi:hypothetical protein